MTDGPRPHDNGWLGSFILLLCVLAAGLIVGEVLVRLLYPDMVLFPRYHARAQYGEYSLRRLRPETSFRHSSRDGSWLFTTNAQGFRDDADYPQAKPAGELRVLVLGDSHAEGMEARQDQTFSEVLERALIRDGREARVLNSGISGFSTAEELAFLENAGIDYAPDWVVLAVFANDFEDNVKSGLFGLTDGRLESRGKSHIPGVAILELVNAMPPARWLSENSYLYSLALNTVWETAKRWLKERSEARLVTEYAVPSEAVDDYKKQLLLRLVQRMHDFCAARGIGLILVDVPLFAPPEDHDFASSLPPDLVPGLRAASEALILSEPLLGPYRGVAEFHVPHGHRHISELTHLLLGQAIAAVITAADNGEESQ